MKNLRLLIGRVLLTLSTVVIAAYVIWKLVDYYTFAPWTRDGHIRADVVQVAPDVSGLIASVYAGDNERVHKGQLLYEIDRDRYEFELKNALATAAERRAALEELRNVNARNTALGALVSAEATEHGRASVAVAEAQLEAATAAVDTARLNLQRTRIFSPVDGYINDRAPRVGEFVTAGHPVLSIIDSGSFRVDGYFEETRLSGINIGDSVDIKVMGEPILLHGHVESLVAGIEDRNRVEGANLLPDVNPAFSWVRLAERIPVRIALDKVPVDFRLIAGRTATITVHRADQPRAGRNDD